MTPESLANGVTDTTALEIELIETAFGKALPALLQVIGLTDLSSRQDLDLLAARLQSSLRFEPHSRRGGCRFSQPQGVTWPFQASCSDTINAPG